MKCNNCQSEMEFLDFDEYWCSECGTMFDIDHNLWSYPKSIENTKKIVAELVKCRNIQLHLNSRLNSIDRDNMDRVDLNDER